MIFNWLKKTFGYGEVYCEDCMFFHCPTMSCHNPDNTKQSKFKTWHSEGVVTTYTYKPCKINYNNWCGYFVRNIKGENNG